MSCARLRRRLPRSWLKGDPEQRFLYQSTMYLQLAFIGFSVCAFFLTFAWLDIIYMLAAYLGGLYIAIGEKLGRAGPDARRRSRRAATAPAGSPGGLPVRHASASRVTASHDGSYRPQAGGRELADRCRRSGCLTGETPAPEPRARLPQHRPGRRRRRPATSRSTLPRARFADQLDELAPARGHRPARPGLHRRQRATRAWPSRSTMPTSVPSPWAWTSWRVAGSPATIFVAPGLLDGHAFWWDALARARCAGLAPELRRRALEQLRGQDEADPARGLTSQAYRATSCRTTPDRPPKISCAPRHRRWDRSPWARIPGATRAFRASTAPDIASGDDPLARLARGPVRLGVGSLALLPVRALLTHGHRGSRRRGLSRCACDRRRVDSRACAGRSTPIPRLNVPAGLSARGFALRAAGLFCR